MPYNNEITFNGVVLHVPTCTPLKKQKKLKQVMGRTLTQINIIGLDDSQWELDIKGIIYGTTTADVDTNRSNLEALDNATAYTYLDGVHDGNYFLEPGSLKFADKGDEKGHYKYTMRLVES